MLVTFQNKHHETIGCTIYTRATLHFLWIFLCSDRKFDQSHSSMKVDCAHKLAVPLNVKRVCFVSKLVKFRFTNIIFVINSYRYTNADWKTCQYLCPHMKVIYRRFQSETYFTFWDMSRWDAWKIYLQTLRNNRIC